MTCLPTRDAPGSAAWPQGRSPATNRLSRCCSQTPASRYDASWPIMLRSSAWSPSAPSSSGCGRAPAGRSSPTPSTRRSRGSMAKPHPFALRRMLALRQFAALRDADLAELALLAENVTEVRLPAGTVIATAGHRLAALHLILTGEIA